MSTSTADLFKSYTIDEHLDQERRWLEGRITELKTVEDVDHKGPEIIANSAIAKLDLLRDRAEFVTKEGDTQVRVDLRIPVQGATRLLWTRPKTSGHAHPNATINDGRWPDKEEGASITLGKAFPAGTTPDEVRQWAKELVDRIELTLADLHADIDTYNATVKSEAEELLTERRAVLSTGSSLRDGLGGGI